MFRYLRRLPGALAIVGLMIGPVGVGHAQETLPGEIQGALAAAAAESDEALLAAVAEAVAENPELAQAIVDEATRLNPDLDEEIVAAATEAGGDIEIVPAAGPGILGVLAGVAGVGGAAAGIAAAGGGGGGDAAASRPPRGEFETREYNAQKGLGLIKAADAYERGLTGEGVIVAVLDSGLDVTHPEFAGRIAPGGFDFVLGTPHMTDPDGHGTHVSGIIGANKDGVGMHGVAFDSLLLPIRILDEFGGGSLDVVPAAFDLAVANGAAVINNSWGSGIDVTAVTREYIEAAMPDVVAAFQRTIDNGTIIVFAAGNGLLANPTIFPGLPFRFPEFENLWVAVMSVNLNGSESSAFTNRCGVAAAWCIAAPGGNIFSTLPVGGSNVSSDTEYGRLSGTSMAAPHVSGAIAVVLELFSLNPEEALTRLFVSANDSGIYGNSSIFGHGLLDLEAATRPLGTIFVLTGDSLSGPAFALDTTRISLGSAFGDGLSQSLAGVTLAVFDSYDAPFYLDLGAFVQTDSGRLDLDMLLSRFGKSANRQTLTFDGGELGYAMSSLGEPGAEALAPGLKPRTELAELSFTQRLGRTWEITLNYNTHPASAFGLYEGGTVDRRMMISTDAFAAPYLSFGERGYNLTTATKLPGLGTLRLGSFFGEADGEEDTGSAFGAVAELAVPVGERANLAFQIGMLSESETFLGSETEGAFDLEGGVPTYFGGVSAELALSDAWRLVGSAYAGLSYPEAAADSLFADVSPILTQSLTLGVVGDDVFRDGDRFGFLVNQPLRVTSGSAEIAFTTGRDPERNVYRDSVTADLAPDGREIDVEAFYGLALGEMATLTTSAMLRREPGHIESAEPEGVFMLRFEHSF